MRVHNKEVVCCGCTAHARGIENREVFCHETERVLKDAAVTAAVEQVLRYLEKDPEANIPRIMKLVDTVTPKDWYAPQRAAFRKAIEEKSNWYQLILKAYELDPGVRQTFFRNFILNASLLGSARQDEVSAKKTATCPGPSCWTPPPPATAAAPAAGAEYGDRLNLSFAELDSIVTQGKELGTYMYIFTGGEPLVRKKDVIALCEKHSDCEFLSFTNGTLIDEAFCRDLLRVRNFVPAFSLEGFEEANDSRRGEGSYQSVMDAMRLMKATSCRWHLACYTSRNYADISSEKFFDEIISAGALFVWFFHYMPVGSGAAPELLPTPEQRTELYGASARSARPRPSSRWISRTTPSTWAAASRAAAGTCTSTPAAMWNPAFLSTTPTSTSAAARCWKR